MKGSKSQTKFIQIRKSKKDFKVLDKNDTNDSSMKWLSLYMLDYDHGMLRRSTKSKIESPKEIDCKETIDGGQNPNCMASSSLMNLLTKVEENIDSCGVNPPTQRTTFNLDEFILKKCEDFDQKAKVAPSESSMLCARSVCKSLIPNQTKSCSFSIKPVKKTTEYMDNFVKKQFTPTESIRAPEPCFHPTHDEMTTIYRADYVIPKTDRFHLLSSQIVEPKHKSGIVPAEIKAPASKISSYRENYLDFKNIISVSSIRPSQISDIDSRLPFYCQSTNREYGNFTRKQVLPNIDGRLFKQQQYKNPIASDVAFKVSPCTREFFQPYTDFERTQVVLPRPENIMDKLPSFKNQFMTSSNIHDGKFQNLVPCKRFMDNIRS